MLFHILVLTIVHLCSVRTVGTAVLEPAWEARFAAHASGLRPGRCTMDAIEAIRTTMRRQEARQGVLDADIRGGLDRAS